MSTTQGYLCVISDLTDECNDLRAALAERDAKLAALEGLYLDSLADATHWQLYKARKDAVIAAGMGRKAMRDATAGAAPNLWKDAVLNALADHAMDAPVTDTQEQIVKSIIAMAVTMATDSTIAAGAVRSIPKGIRRKLLDELGAELECADGDEWDDAVVTMVENYLAAGAAPVPTGWQIVPVEALTRWRDAFSEELSAWDIDPPLHHMQTSHDEISAILAASPKEAMK